MLDYALRGRNLNFRLLSIGKKFLINSKSLFGWCSKGDFDSRVLVSLDSFILVIIV